jgi:diguanylate cyclase (GGDEF)-like protein
MSFASFDVDKFGALNDQYGPMLCDRILFQIGQILQSAVGKADLVGRYAGQRFMVALLDAGPRAALKSIELMRQSIEKTTFLYEDKKIKLTVGGVFVEIKPSDDYVAVMERMEKTMKLVKEKGPNHTYLHSGRDPEPVESPSFGAEEKDVSI